MQDKMHHERPELNVRLEPVKEKFERRAREKCQ